MTEGERKARRVAQLMVAVMGNSGLPGKYADIAIVLALEVASARHTPGGWAVVRYGVVAERSASQRYHVRRLVKVLVPERLIEQRLSAYYPTADGVRRDSLIRSLVGREYPDMLEALAVVSPDWQLTDPRSDHNAKTCPDCGGTELLVQKWCKSCGALVAEYTEGATPPGAQSTAEIDA